MSFKFGFYVSTLLAEMSNQSLKVTFSYEKERVKYYRDKVNNCEQALKRAEDHYRSNMREWKAQKKYHMVREARWARDQKSAELKT